MTSRINISFNQTGKSCQRDKIPFFLSRVKMTTILKFNQISNLSFGLLIALRIQRSKEAIYKALKKTCCVTHNIIEGSKAKRKRLQNEAPGCSAPASRAVAQKLRTKGPFNPVRALSRFRCQLPELLLLLQCVHLRGLHIHVLVRLNHRGEIPIRGISATHGNHDGTVCF